MSIKIQLAKPFYNTEIKEVEKVLKSGWVAGQGPKNKELEEKFVKYIGSKYAVCVSNCTAGLHLSLISSGIGKGDEVIVPDYTYPATAHAVLYTGARPVFVDIEPKTYNIDVSLIKEKITEKTKAIIPVHLYGQCADMGKIMKIAREYDLKVIEDAACAVGSKYKGRFAGNMGDVAAFSFHARKNITSGEGGIVTTGNKKIAKEIRSLSCFGIESAFARGRKFNVPEFVKLGYNYKLSDIAASIVLQQLKKSEEFIKKRQELAKEYNEKLDQIKLIKTPYTEKCNRHVYQTYSILVDKNLNRNKVIAELKEKGIQTQIGTYALHRQPVYKNLTNCEEADFPNSSIAFEHSIALPMFYELNSEQIDYIVYALKEILK